ncbi:MAG: cytochrome c oxidase subunit 3 [Planctomycetota bacterium]|jgi:heme/copper-type cytochrome/quinol oxidase subunit 3
MDTTHVVHAADPADHKRFGNATGGKVGMWIFIAQDGMAFGGLLLAYALLRIFADVWPAEGLTPTDVLGIGLTAFATFVLICSSVSMVMAVQASQHARQGATVFWLLLTILGGVVFLGIQAYEYTHLVHLGIGFTEATFQGQALNPMFGSTFYVVTGFHGAHVTAGVIYLTCILFGAMKGKYTKGGLSHSPVELVGLFWHFVDLVWILVFTFIYLL